ncbi:MAG TPA: magnesium transporter CorA family protein [Candidatus Paceibacterota bacterium]|nr:magnesium transporter CorA family protein [Candidatus Paceibacterota bacterium]
MLFRYAYRGGVWVDLEHPTEEEIRSIVEEFSISERLQTELFEPTPAPLVASDAGVIFLVLHFPTHGTVDGEVEDQEVDFVIGANFIITVRYKVVASLRSLQKLLETQKIVSPDDTMESDTLLEIIFIHLYTSVRDHINTVAGRLTHIEHDMFNGFERTTVRAISNTSREFLHTEASLANQEESLGRFLKACITKGIFGTTFTERAERILAERAQVARLGATYRAVATELRETNASLLEAHQNEIMKKLTVISFGVLPLELIALVFGMHALGTPLEQDPYAFWIILAIMLVVGALMVTFFARRRWFN